MSGYELKCDMIIRQKQISFSNRLSDNRQGSISKHQVTLIMYSLLKEILKGFQLKAENKKQEIKFINISVMMYFIYIN
jgi:hypothetical protein